MAIGWLALLKTVPWTEVVRNAPKIADGAKKLWVALATKPTASETEIDTDQLSFYSESQSINSLQERLATVESACSDLHKQMIASSEIITELAEQNAQLVKKIELNRIRTLRLAGATMFIAVIAIIHLITTYSH